MVIAEYKRFFADDPMCLISSGSIHSKNKPIKPHWMT
jgi:hypothetical protein